VTLRAVPPEPELNPAEPSALARVTGNPSGFLSETWSQRAAVFPDADGGGFADLLSLDDVDRLLTTTSPRTPTFRLVKAGSQIPESSYTRSGRTGSKPVSGMADPARIFALFDDGATIVLQGVHRYHEPVAQFCRALELELGHPCQANAYITPAGAQGLALHADPHDVFVLQAFGRKQWEVHGAPAETERDPLEATVDPGDAIYMPKGTPHAASAQAIASGHLTIGVHVTTWREVLDGAWREVERDPVFDEPVAAGWHRHVDAFADELRDRIAAASSALASVDAEALADRREQRFLSSRAQLMHGALRAQLELGAIDDATPIRRRDGSVCEIRPRDDRLEILLGDRALEMPGWLEPALRHVAASDHFRPRDLLPEIGDPASRLVLMRRLVREGLLVPDDLGVR
jgi:cupin superfamily protein